MHEMWAIYDTANQSYLTGGNARALEHGRAIDPFESHRYFDIRVASKMLKRLNQEIIKADAATLSYMIPIWKPESSTVDNYSDHPVRERPILEIHHIYSPQIAVVR